MNPLPTTKKRYLNSVRAKCLALPPSKLDELAALLELGALHARAIATQKRKAKPSRDSLTDSAHWRVN